MSATRMTTNSINLEVEILTQLIKTLYLKLIYLPTYNFIKITKHSQNMPFKGASLDLIKISTADYQELVLPKKVIDLKHMIDFKVR